jgi:acetyltransferase-like isoleucine patch superfamily enzyme
VTKDVPPEGAVGGKIKKSIKNRPEPAAPAPTEK